MFLSKHVNLQLFNKEETYQTPSVPDHQRMAFQTFGADFTFQKAQVAFENMDILMTNVGRYLNHNMQFKFTTMTKFHEAF